MLHLYKHMWHTWVELIFFSKNKMFISKKHVSGKNDEFPSE